MRSLRLVTLLAIPAQLAFGQQAAPRGTSLTLEEAIATARKNSPLYLQTENNIRTQDAQVRSAYGQLLPQANANFRTQWQQGGTQYIQGIALDGGATDAYSSSYQIGLSYNVTAALRYAPRAAKANRSAAEADLTNMAELLRSTITQNYITALQSEATAAVLDTLVATAQGQLDLVQARLKVGAGTIIDVRTAEVAHGQAQVNALTAHNAADVNKIRLFQSMGVPADRDAKLTTTFPIAQPTFSLDSVLDIARRVNPDLAARKSRQYAAELNVGVAKSNYLPSLFLSTGYAAQAFGYVDSDILAQQAIAGAANSRTSCLTADSLRVGAGLAAKGCGSGTLGADQLAAIRATNKPFKFQKAPYGVSASLSLPIFNGFQREAQVENARVQRDNAAYDVRARNLQLTTDVTQAYLNLVTAAKTVELQTQIAARAAEDLALNEASYRVGAKTFLDVNVARGQYERTQIDRVNSVYEYHKAFAALENAIGRPLR
ncbi:MAG TPA: TolC family protein [Gemmatimonadaceae bacterium]